jgi:hypothetical protein
VVDAVDEEDAAVARGQLEHVGLVERVEAKADAGELRSAHGPMRRA